MNAIEVSGLRKSYPRSKGELVRAVDNLDLTVPAGQVLGFLGANGAGKTTTIKMLCGLVIPDAGRMAINGYDVRRQGGQAKRQIGAVLEGTRNIYWRMSSLQNLLYYAGLKGALRGARERARRLLTELELWEQRDQPVGEFSRGMQQKVAIACALIADPPIVLLDEPTLGLDVTAARTVKEWVRRLAADEKKTILLTTHQLDMAEELCDRVVIMRAGRPVADKPTPELLRLFSGEHYQIRVSGVITPGILAALQGKFAGLAAKAENGQTILTGGAVTQDDLLALVNALHTLDLPLAGVEKAAPTLEDVFVRLMAKEGTALPHRPAALLQHPNGAVPATAIPEVES
jgi:ABC-2 type transport system ATP-binding protein